MDRDYLSRSHKFHSVNNVDSQYFQLSKHKVKQIIQCYQPPQWQTVCNQVGDLMNFKRSTKHRIYRKLIYGIIMAGIIIAGMPLLVSSLLAIYKVLLLLGVLFCVCGMVLGLILLRCPHCRGFLYIQGPSPVFCRHCGAKLDWNIYAYAPKAQHVLFPIFIYLKRKLVILWTKVNGYYALSARARPEREYAGTQRSPTSRCSARSAGRKRWWTSDNRRWLLFESQTQKAHSLRRRADDRRLYDYRPLLSRW